jgi:hypothetical protein
MQRVLAAWFTGILFWEAVAGACCALGGPGGAPAQRPNILWLIAEDMGPEALSCSGTPQVWTPHLDRLAGQGVRYTRLYTGPVCSPSRSSFMTGMYATTIGAHNHRIHNLAASDQAEHRSALERLRGALEQWIEETNDQGRIFEPAAIAAAKGATKPGAGPSTPPKAR